MKRQNRTTWVSTSSFGIFDTLALFSSQGKLGKGCPKSLYTLDFCIALLGIAPRFSRRPLSNYNKAMSHEEAEPHNMGFYLSFWDLDYPCPIFLSGKIGQGCPKSSILLGISA